jgi:hypothetical protein
MFSIVEKLIENKRPGLLLKKSRPLCTMLAFPY